MWSLGGFQRWQEAWREEGSLGRWWGGEPGTSSRLPRAAPSLAGLREWGRGKGLWSSLGHNDWIPPLLSLSLTWWGTLSQGQALC